jgi:hypothetical protein
MARTTADAVKGIVEVDSDSVADLTPFIETASELVTELCEPAGYDETRLELIERWLAAHFYTIRDNRRVSEAIGSVNEWYQYKLGLNLACSMYGQQAMMLDTKLTLAALSNAAQEVKSSAAISVTSLHSCDDNYYVGEVDE